MLCKKKKMFQHSIRREKNGRHLAIRFSHKLDVSSVCQTKICKKVHLSGLSKKSLNILTFCRFLFLRRLEFLKNVIFDVYIRNYLTLMDL